MSDKLQQAISAIKSGDKKTGYRLLAEVIKANPENEEAENAWLWMAVVVKDPNKKRQCLETALDLNPNNEIAKKGLQSLSLPTTKTFESPQVEDIFSPQVPPKQPENQQIHQLPQQSFHITPIISDQVLIQEHIAKLSKQGWQVISQTEFSVQLRRPRNWSCLLLALGLLLLPFWGIGLIILLIAAIDYAIKKDQIVFVTAQDLRAKQVNIMNIATSSMPTDSRILTGIAIAVGIFFLFVIFLASRGNNTSNNIPLRSPTRIPLPATFTPVSRNANPTDDTKSDNLLGVGYLWLDSNPSSPIPIISHVHDRFPVDIDELARWILAGEACVADPGTRAYLEDYRFTKTDVTVLEGECQDFYGWIVSESWQDTRP
ncbi:MAG: hypothetical protein H6658_16875 [Ardenticatenaceae bacterium]|nr:hypothetical protein [Ardenticatenaceae bacterium]